jgi:hypothetical protein
MLPSAISQNCTSTYQIMGFSNKLPPLVNKISQEQKHEISPVRKNLPLLQVQEDAADIIPSAEKKTPQDVTNLKNDFKYSSPIDSPIQSPRTNQDTKSGKHSEFDIYQVINRSIFKSKNFLGWGTQMHNTKTNY